MLTRFCAVSDTHLRHPKNMPTADVLIHAGDATMHGTEKELRAFGDWLGTLEYEEILVGVGNHDIGFEENREKAEYYVRSSARRPIQILIDEPVSINGINLYFSPYVPNYGDWAYMLPRGRQLREKWAKVPKDTHILVTHGPPLFTGDMVHDPYTLIVQNVGDEDLRERIRQLDVPVHVSGHIHGGYGVRKTGNTTHINCAVVDDSYQLRNRPVVFDFDGKTVQVIPDSE